MKEILQKYGTAIRYGDVGTRLFALSVPVCILAAVICVIIAFVANVMPLFLGGLLFGIGAFALHQRFDISEGVVEVDPKEPKAKKEKKSKEASQNAEPSKAAEPVESAAEPAATEEVAPETKPKKEKKKKEKKPKEKKPAAETEVEASESVEDETEAKPKKEKKAKKEKPKKPEKAEKPEKPAKEKPEKAKKEKPVKEKKPRKKPVEEPEEIEEEQEPDTEEILDEIMEDLFEDDGTGAYVTYDDQAGDQAYGMQEDAQAYEDAGYEEAPQDTANAGFEEEAADPMDVLDDPDLPKERPEVDFFDDDDDEEEAESSETYDEDDEDDPNLTEEERKVRKKQNELQKYDKKAMKHYFYKYKVRRDHKTLMIDDWKEKKVHQAPAYIWLDRKNIHFLVLGDEAREMSVPISKATTLKLHKGVACKAKEEYIQFRKPSLINTLFSPYLPAYSESEQNGRMVVTKNLFELGDGIMLTTASAKVAYEMLQLNVDVDDIVMRDVRYNDYFKAMYRYGLIFREGILPAKVYQAKTNETLQAFAESDVSDNAYNDTLQQMYQHRLITMEYVNYYRDYRETHYSDEEDAEAAKPKAASKKRSLFGKKK